MTGKEKIWHTLTILRSAEEYVQDVNYLLWAEEQDEKELLDCIHYISSKYRLWINEIGAKTHPTLHVTTSSEEYDEAYKTLTLEDYVAQCEWLVDCILVGASVKVGIYQNVTQALHLVEEEQ